MCGSASSDMCVPLAALDAIVEVEGPTSDKCRLPTSIDYRAAHPTGHSETGRIKQSSYPLPRLQKPVCTSSCAIAPPYAFALVSVAAAVELADKRIKTARLAMGGMAHKPWRFTEAESFLIGKAANTETFEQAAVIAPARKCLPTTASKLS